MNERKAKIASMKREMRKLAKQIGKDFPKMANGQMDQSPEFQRHFDLFSQLRDMGEDADLRCWRTR